VARVLSGQPINGQATKYVKAAGTDNDPTDPRIIVFGEPVRPCIVTNHCTNASIVVKVNTEANGTVSNDFDNDTGDDGLGHIIIPPASVTDYDSADGDEVRPTESAPWVDVSLGGQLCVSSVSIATQHASDDLDDVSVVGWTE
jgi:hypothetical protein